MSAILSAYSGGTLELQGQTYSWGSIIAPVRAVTVASGQQLLNDRIVVRAGTSSVVWLWADTRGFERLGLTVLSNGGYLYGAHRIDTVTSESDQTPSTSNGPWNHWSLSCFEPFILTTDRAYFNATATTQVGDTAGLPTLWAGTKTLGVISSVALRNEGTTDVEVQRVVVQ